MKCFCLMDDIFVRREELLQMFDPAPSRATFFRWVDQGRVKKARDLDGWYLLNATRVHQGMKPIDVTQRVAERMALSLILREGQVLYLSILSVDDRFCYSHPTFELPSMLSPTEIEKMANAMKHHCRVLEAIVDSTERTTYCQGYLDAVEALVGAVDAK